MLKSSDMQNILSSLFMQSQQICRSNHQCSGSLRIVNAISILLKIRHRCAMHCAHFGLHRCIFPTLTPPPGFTADAKFRTPILFSGNSICNCIAVSNVRLLGDLNLSLFMRIWKIRIFLCFKQNSFLLTVLYTVPENLILRIILLRVQKNRFAYFSARLHIYSSLRK